MTDRPQPVPDPDQLTIPDTTHPAQPPHLPDATPQQRADAQAAWAKETGDDIPYEPAVMG